MKFKLKAYSIYQIGNRANQEDSIYPPYKTESERDRLFIVCDGMGGHDSGEVASQTVCEAMSSSVLSKTDDSFNESDFNLALQAAYTALDAKDTGAEKKMGTTLTFLKLHSEGAMIAHMGDSRVYHIRPGKEMEDTEILFVTRDHSLINDLIKAEVLTPEEAKYSRQKNVITRALQPNMERRSKADIYVTKDIQPGDYFYLCSDGMLEQMEDNNIRYLFSEKVKDDEKVRMLIKLTEENRDNHSAYIVHILDVDDKIEKEVNADVNQPSCEDNQLKNQGVAIETQTKKIQDENTDTAEEHHNTLTKTRKHKKNNTEHPDDRKWKSLLWILVALLVVSILFCIVYIMMKK